MKIHHLILAILFTCSTYFSFGQSIKARIVTSSMLDFVCSLEFNKNNTYKHVCWSGWSGYSTLDSGNYIISNNQLHFDSKFKNRSEDIKFENYYIETLRIKKNENISYFHTSPRKFSIIGKKYIVISPKPFNNHE